MPVFQGTEASYPWKVGTQKKPDVKVPDVNFNFQLQSPTDILPWQISSLFKTQLKGFVAEANPTTKPSESNSMRAELEQLFLGYEFLAKCSPHPLLLPLPRASTLGNLPRSCEENSLV